MREREGVVEEEVDKGEEEFKEVEKEDYEE